MDHITRHVNVHPTASLMTVLLATLFGGCTHPGTEHILQYMSQDEAYLALPSGPARVDALYQEARTLTGSNAGAIDLLGSIAATEGVQLRHPFNTGLTATGPLSPVDKTGHFFSHAMWRMQDRHRIIHVATFNSYAWEVLGEIKSWFDRGKGWDWDDIWANRIGQAFADRVYENQNAPLLPSEIIRTANQFMPSAVAERDDPRAVSTTPPSTTSRTVASADSSSPSNK